MARNNSFLFLLLITGLLLLAGSATASRISIGDIAVQKGGTATVNVILDAVPPKGLAGYEIDVTIADPARARITGVAFNSSLGGLTEVVPTPYPFTKGYFQWADTGEVLQPAQAGQTIRLATITVEGLSSGSTVLNAGLSDFTSDGNELLSSVTTVSSPAIVVTSAGTPTAIPVALPGYPKPSDLNNDGLCEDVNGDGLFNYSDVTLYFQNWHWIESNEPVVLFDYDKNGMIDFGDIVVLNQMRG
jgi:hypothetical protein